MSYLEKINAIKATELSFIDQDYIELLERIVLGSYTTIQTDNAQTQIDKWYSEL